MKNKKKIIHDDLKRSVARTLEWWISERMQDHQGPARKPAAKGETKGFSSGKMKAALLMPWYPSFYSLKEISLLADVPIASIKAWRGDEDFQDVVIEEGLKLGRVFASHIKGLIADNLDSIFWPRVILADKSCDTQDLAISLVDVLAILDPVTHEGVLDLRDVIDKVAWVSMVRRLGYGKKNTSHEKRTVEDAFDIVLHPEKHPGISEDDRAAIGNELKNWMINLLEGEKDAR